MNITLKTPRGCGDWLAIRWLYFRAFPAAERKPFSIIRKMYRQGKADVWCILRSGKFAGFAATVNGDDLILLDYLAISREYRGMGVGSKALALLMEAYSGQGVFVEIESTRCAGVEQEKRKRFYLAAGMEDLHVEARVFGVDMELLGIRCRLNFEDYQNFYREYYNAWAAEHLEPIKS